MPKQFLKIFNDKSLLELTLERLNGIPHIRQPIIITSNTYMQNFSFQWHVAIT